MQTHLIPYADINALLGLLLSRMQGVLGDKLIGLYVFGSLVTGDFDYGSSDIDLIAATSVKLNEEEIANLKLMHEDIAREEKQWDGRIEVGYIPVDELRRYNPRYQQPMLSPGETFHVTTVGASWIINRYVLREKGIAVHGPAAETLVDAISPQELIQAVRSTCQDWRVYINGPNVKEWRPGQAYAILTMCRILYTLKFGEFVSKLKAARWAQQNLEPEWSSLIGNALLWRETWRDEDVDHDATLPETLRFVRFALSQCQGSGIV